MNSERYQRGGDIYDDLAGQYNYAVADRAASLAAADKQDELQRYLSDLRTAARTDRTVEDVQNDFDSRHTTTLGQFADQIVNDPLAAPLDSLNDQLQKVAKNIVGNPFVLLLVIGLVLFGLGQLGGVSGLKRRLA